MPACTQTLTSAIEEQKSSFYQDRMRSQSTIGHLHKEVEDLKQQV